MGRLAAARALLSSASLVIAGAGPAAAQQWGAPPVPLDAAGLARRLEVRAEPAHPFRYNQPREAPNQTKRLLARPRAFFPGERVSLAFSLPEGTTLAAPARLKVELAFHDLLGARLASLGEATLAAGDGRGDGRLDWTVPQVGEGQYLLAAHLRAEDGRPLASRSDVVFVTPEYPGLLAAAEQALAQARQRADSLAPLLREVSLPSTEMLVEDAQMAWSDFGQPPRDWAFVKRQLETARAYADRLAAGEDPWQGRTGAFTKAYRSGLDGTLQPYALYVPPSYDAARSWPLLVSLHGSTSNHLLNRRRVFGLGNRPGEGDFEAIRNDVDYPDTGFVVLSPYGRGESAGYNGIAEADVLRALEDVQRAYRVDADRVHLTGLSMGGGGTWHIGLRHADRFASISPVCGNADLDFMPWTAGWGALDKELMPLTGYSRIVENASNLKVFIYHGDEDDTVDVNASRRMLAAFKAAGLDNAQYFELPGVTHFAWDFAYRDAAIFARLSPLRRDPFPERVVYSTFSPRYNKAYWLRVDRIDRGFALARVEGTQKAGRFELEAANVTALSLLLAPAIAPLGRPLEVRVDGRLAFRGVPRGDVLSLARVKGAWRATAPWTGPAQGPPDHAEASFRAPNLAQFGPHVYVYGTAGDAATTAASKAGAEMLADWGRDVRARWRVLADREVTPEILQANNLVLVGTAATNGLVARMQDRLPLRQDATGTYAGTRKVAGPAATYRLTHPNPLAPGRLVLVYGGGSPAALKRFRPTDRRSVALSLFADYLVIGEDDKVALEGYFKDDYRIPAP